MGYLAVWTMVRHLEGYDVSEGGKDQYTGEYVVTRDNLDADEDPPAVRARVAGEARHRRTAPRHAKYKKKS